MRSTIIIAAIALAVQGSAAADDPEIWKGAQVLPKLGTVVSVGNETISSDKLDLPWVVREMNGERLLVGDRKRGWVERSQVVTLHEAVAYYSQLIEDDQNVAWAYSCRAAALLHSGKVDRAIADYSESLRLEPKAITYRGRAHAWIKKRDAEKAMADYDQAIQLDPQNAVAYKKRGGLWHYEKDYDKALADYSRAIQLDPDDVDAYCSRAAVFGLQQEYGKAIADCEQAIRLDPKAERALLTRRVTWLNQGEYDKAIADCDQAIQLDPEETDAYYVRAAAWLKKKDFDKAIADYTAIEEIDPHSEMLYVNRGLAWQAKGEYERAIADHEQAISLSPRYALSYNNLAWLKATCPAEKFRDGQQAVELATKACELSDWKVANFCGTLASAYAESGDFEAAIKYETKAIEMNPADTKYVAPAKERLALYEQHKPFRGK